jgi:hypothetical protein
MCDHTSCAVGEILLVVTVSICTENGKNPAAAQAMEIQKYYQMSKEDKMEYFGLLLQGAGQVLQAQVRTADIQKVEKLFSTTMPCLGASYASAFISSSTANFRNGGLASSRSKPRLSY